MQFQKKSMTNLIIIGNGFDMAHGLKTSYADFIKHLINNKFYDNYLYSDLFDFSKATEIYCKNYDDLIKHKDSNLQFRKIFKTENMFFERMTSNFFNLNWCDIERDYFTELLNIGNDRKYETAQKLNFDFEIVKKYLSEYLTIEQSNFKQVWAYEQYFEKMSFTNSMILNFNYTNTILNYTSEYNTELVQIHGKLNDKDYPIVFGYAADDDESRKLLQFDDKEFMRNIKKHNYKRTKEENRLIEFLDNNQDIEVSIIGHSCGLSDKLILNQILNNKNVSEIRTYYYNDYEHYFETQVNIDRIMNNDSNFRKLINFQDSIIIPQKDKESELELFSNEFNLIFDKRKKANEDKYRIV
jgi:hypothetical protein